MTLHRHARAGALRHAGASCALALALSACAVTPPVDRADAAAAATASAASATPQQVARQVSVVGHGGRLTRPEREALLKRIGGQTLVQRHLAAMTEFGEVDLHADNEAVLLVDGPATFGAMFEAIDRARRSILLESYIVEDEAISQRFAAALAKKRAEGVQVALLYDGVGSIATDSKFFDALKAAGVSVCEYNPPNPAKANGRYYDITERDHRKILTVDREVGFTGGINISGVYSSGSFSHRERRDLKKDGWRDTQVRLRGPAAAALDDLVRDTWTKQRCTGALPAAPATAVPVSAVRAGSEVVRIVPSAPEDEFNRIYALMLTSIDAAEKSVHVTMSYFAPGDDFIDALADAAARGVDVRLVLPSLSDFSPVLHAGRARYERLLASGVKIFELQDAVLHAKTFVIDGVVSSVGSSNMDWRSFVANTEVNAVVFGDAFGRAMEQMFERDVAASKPITLDEWRRRPATQKAKESLARLFERFW